jgi:hypothetical protein
MEFLKQIAEQADQIERTRLYEGVEQTLAETFDAVVAMILESKDITEQELAEAACTAMMKDKKEEEEAAVEPAGDEEEEEGMCPKCKCKVCKCKKMGKSLKEALDATYQAEVDLLAQLSEDTLRACYAKIAESFDSVVNQIMKNDKHLKKEGKNNTRRKAAEAIAATIARKKGKAAK